jgi:Domain of unknown function (DUF927)
VSIDTFKFLKMVAPVSPETWITVHHRVWSDHQKQYIFPGNAHKTVHSAQKDAEYWAAKAHCVYISMGMYRNAGPMPERGIHPKADRTYQNLVACKNLYLDVDVKEGGYASLAEAAAAVKAFLAWAALPMPTVMVGSGSGGLHVYWTMNIAFDEAEFKSMAGKLISAGVEHGLLFDRACTRDSTRLLRVAGTWNFKFATPIGVEPVVDATPVVLLYCANEHVDIDVMRKALSRWKATITQGVNTPQQVTGGTDVHGLPLDENADLTGGMKKDYAPVSIDEVATHCAFIRNTLGAGGANLVGDPQWHQVIALACHTDNPSETARRLCEKSPYYTLEGNEAKLAAAQQARLAREAIGPPKCDTIAIEREECKTCPHAHLHTTPVSIGFKLPRNGHAYHGRAATPSANSIGLPPGYYYDAGNPKDHRVYKTVVDNGQPIDGVLAFEYPLIPGSATLEWGSPSFQFVFETVQGEKNVTKRFDTTIAADSMMLAKAFASTGMTITTKPELPRAFMASYISLLAEKEETLITAPAFGWSQDRNGDMGFAFAGEFVSPAGVSKCARPPDGADNYRVMGDEQVWIDLMKHIVTDDRPDLACMIASSFGAPLVGLAGELGLLMGVTSPASGIGKSTALLGGQAVWSSPRVGGLSDTVVFTFAKAATLRNLPLFYDEIKGEKQLRDMTLLAFQLTGGREKGRADRSGKMREVKEFRTLCGYAANGSILQGVRDADKGTDASWLRIFEMQGIVLPETAPDFAYNVNTLLSGLALNHGGIGKKYAALLGTNHDVILKTLTAFKAQFGQELGANPKVERYWIAAIATTIMGACLANSMGVVKFPVNAMKDFMFSEFRRMQGEMAEDPSDYSKDNALLSTIGAFLNDKQPKNMVKLDRTWTGKSRPPKDYAKILNEQNNWGALQVQVSGEPLTLRISDGALSEWCDKTKHPKNILVGQMKAKLGAKMSNGMIGSGSRLGGAKENIWVIQATGTIIEDYLEYGIHNKFLPP